MIVNEYDVFNDFFSILLAILNKIQQNLIFYNHLWIFVALKSNEIDLFTYFKFNPN